MPKRPQDICVVRLAADARAIVLTDLHGNVLPLQNIIAQQCPALGKKDMVFISGDIIDKGSDVVALYQYIREINQQHASGQDVPEIIMSMGNHEAMFLSWIATVICIVKDKKFDFENYKVTAMQEDKRFQGVYPDIFKDKEIPGNDLVQRPVPPAWMTIVQKLHDLEISRGVLEKICHRFGGESFVMLAANYTANYGPNWLGNINNEDLADMINYFADLPIIVRGIWAANELIPAFNIVHADLPLAMNKIDFVSRLSLNAEQKWHALWARDEELCYYAGVGITFCGHSPSNLGVKLSLAKDMIVNLDAALPCSGMAAYVFMNQTTVQLNYMVSDEFDRQSNLQYSAAVYQQLLAMQNEFGAILLATSVATVTDREMGAENVDNGNNAEASGVKREKPDNESCVVQRKLVFMLCGDTKKVRVASHHDKPAPGDYNVVLLSLSHVPTFFKTVRGRDAMSEVINENGHQKLSGASRWKKVGKDKFQGPL